ncbi:MAG: GNAT family N-acetyltransferase [Clostridiales bacterium]|jgi:GNAT superfamily N-acetyltransferase|nr:GNAT family N-acetyltransferase [Clostridiales bacterium]
MQINYRELASNECERIKEMNVSQFVKRAWREVNGIKQWVELNWQDNDFPNGYETHLAALVETFNGGGFAIGAFCEEKLIGFVSVNREIFGTQKYVLLDQIFLSLEFRGMGIGKTLFFQAAEKAKQWGAEKFYVCAGSAEETLAFYYALGCAEAVEPNQRLYESDPNDMQLEYSFHQMFKIKNIRQHPEWLERAADYYSSKWGVDRQLYVDSLTESLTTKEGVPRWYLMLCGKEIIGGFGLIENDFMVRTDLCPWMCAVYIEESERGKQLGAQLLSHARREAAALGFGKVYISTDHIGYYEKYEWRYLGNFPDTWGNDSRVYEADVIM